jgi:nucleoside triphosphatase
MATQHYPEPTVGALIVNTEGQLLLIKSHKWHGRYVVPGGHVELGETLEQALRREVREETGLEIYDIEFLLLQEFIFDDAFWQNRHFIFFDFACKTSGLHVTLNSEAQEYVWVAPGDALDLPVDDYTRRAIEAYLERDL